MGVHRLKRLKIFLQFESVPLRNYGGAGFSDKIFDVMKLLESDRGALISEIEKIEL